MGRFRAMIYPDSGLRNSFFVGTDPLQYLQQYAECLAKTAAAFPGEELKKTLEILTDTSRHGKAVYVAGNGGSFAIAQHLCCDWMKGTFVGHLAPLRVFTLGANQSLLTAVANDFGYEYSFSAQLDMVGQEGDVGVFVSSSGNSPNILRAVEVAKQKKMRTIGLTGFEGGKLREMADVKLHVAVKNYGVVEDFHQMLMHVLAQFFYLSRT